MTKSVKKLINRLPRYKLADNDDHKLLFIKETGDHHIASAFIIDVSASGVGIIVDEEEAPHFGEIIKIEFTIPHHNKMAWWARVVRVEEIENKRWWMKKSEEDEEIQKKISVGLHFKDLPEGHRQAIFVGLNERLDELKKEQRALMIKEYKEFALLHKWKFISLFTLTFLSFFILYFLSRPSENYDPKRGAPWGQRFDFFRWKK